MTLDRRNFLVLSGIAAATQGEILSAAQAVSVPWHQRLKRVGQVNMNERDPVELDVNQWADYWADLKVDAVLVSVTGIVAFYPTNVPYIARHPSWAIATSSAIAATQRRNAASA